MCDRNADSNVVSFASVWRDYVAGEMRGMEGVPVSDHDQATRLDFQPLCISTSPRFWKRNVCSRPSYLSRVIAS